jgi:hypothetical protein
MKNTIKAFRPKDASYTHANAKNILNLLADDNLKKLILLASEIPQTISDKNFSSNLPGIFVLAEYKFLKLYEIIDIASIHIVFDSRFFLSTRINSRYAEVKPVLDKAENDERVFFCTKRCPFTYELSPSEAVNKILELKDYFKKFTSETRKEYFSLISNFTEDKF